MSTTPPHSVSKARHDHRSYGVWFCVQAPPDGRDIATRCAEILELSTLADELGFDILAVPEHHARDDGYIPAPFVLLAAMAARTSRARLMSTVSVGTLWQPVRLAEEILTLDVVSNGRAGAGLGLGNFEPELKMFDLTKRQQVKRFEEIITVTLQALHDESINLDGQHFTYDDLRLSPRPVQQRIPIWLGAQSVPGVVRAARFGLPLILDSVNTITDLAPLVDTYRRACEEHGTNPEVVLMRYGWIGDQRSIEEVWWPHAREMIVNYLYSIPRFEVSDELVDDDGSPRLDPFTTDRLLIGDADHVASLADEWCDRLGATTIVVKFQGTSGPWGDPMRECLSDFARGVIHRPEATAASS